MTGPVPNNQDEPQDPAMYQHHLLLLKSMHCCRPVLYQGRKRFISCLTLHHDTSKVGMTVYLAGAPEALNSMDVQIKLNYETEGTEE
jgi:hypothetical protein